MFMFERGFDERNEPLSALQVAELRDRGSQAKRLTAIFAIHFHYRLG